MEVSIPLFADMLSSHFFTFTFFREVQSGFYLDFFSKKLCEVFLRNVFIYTALFFGEKYMIEILTKKIVDNYIYNTNSYVGWNSLKYNLFFYSILSLIFYVLTFFNLILLLY